MVDNAGIQLPFLGLLWGSQSWLPPAFSRRFRG
jgi:hypothetical protein